VRDIVVTLAILAGVLLTLRKPFVGVLTWTWLGLMNPHMLCWSFAAGQPFAQLVAVATLGSIVAHTDEKKRIPWSALSIVMAIWWAWMFITTNFALNSTGAWQQWDKVWKIQLFVFVTMMMLNSKERIDALVWVMVVSLGLYGVKGGIFTIITGGSYHVMGPATTFIGGNNEIGLALIMTIPLMRYLQLVSREQWLKSVMTISIGLTVVAVLGTQSRGALVGLTVMVAYLVMKSRNKIALIVLLAALLPVGLALMPESWYARMDTIDTYEEDKSAMGRINAWWTAWYLALDRPIVGGGFETFRAWVFAMYAPNPGDVHDVHSIYFESLGEHGFVGLGLFLTIGLLGLRTARTIVRATKNEPRLFWMRDLASMLQVSLIGYAASGAFLGLAYFDFYYTLLATLVALQSLLSTYERERMSGLAIPGSTQSEQLEGDIGKDVTRRGPAGSAAPRSLFDRLKEFYDRL